MTPHMKWGIAGVIVGLILLGFIPFWLAGVLILVAIAIPAGAWLMLDDSQRRRYRELRRRQRGQIRLTATWLPGRGPPPVEHGHRAEGRKRRWPSAA